MKALELLNKLSVNLKNRSITGRDYEVFWRGQIEEAIAELEALQDEVKDAEWRLDLCLAQQRAMQEHKTCDGCKWWNKTLSLEKLSYDSFMINEVKA